MPLGPTMAMRAPLETVKDTPLKISVGPYDLEREVTETSDIISSGKLKVRSKKRGWDFILSALFRVGYLQVATSVKSERPAVPYLAEINQAYVYGTLPMKGMNYVRGWHVQLAAISLSR